MNPQCLMCDDMIRDGYLCDKCIHALQVNREARLRGKPHTDLISHPTHYGGDVPHEVVKCLEAWGLESDALLWNAVKYIARAGKKGDAREDCKKAIWYIQRRLAKMEELMK